MTTVNPSRIKQFTLLIFTLLSIPGMFLMVMPIFNRFIIGFSNTNELFAFPISIRLVTILICVFQLIYLLNEFTRAFIASNEIYLFSLSSTPPSITISYIATRCILRSIPTIVVFSSFTPLLLWKMKCGLGIFLLGIILEFIFVLTLLCLAITLFVLSMKIALLLNISTRTLAILLNIPVVVFTFIFLAYLIPEMGGYLAFQFLTDNYLINSISYASITFQLLGNSNWSAFIASIQAFFYLIISLGAIVIIAIPRWESICLGLVASCENTNEIKKIKTAFFSENITLSIFKKDIKQIQRDQTARSTLISLGITLVIMGALRYFTILTQHNNPESKGVIIIALAFLLFPLILSARAMVCELAFLDVYRLSQAGPYLLIKSKLQSHIVINSILSLLFVIGSMTVIGTKHFYHDLLFLTISVVIFVPLVTSLAIALGIFFPDHTGVRSLIALQMKGNIIYGLVYLFAYAFTSYSYELLLKGQIQSALLFFGAGVFLASSGPIALLYARHRLIHFTP